VAIYVVLLGVKLMVGWVTQTLSLRYMARHRQVRAMRVPNT